MADQAFKSLSRVVGVVTGAGFVMSQCSYVLYPGQAAIIYNRLSGVEEGVHYEGFHFRIPFIEFPKVYDIRLRPAVIETVTGTKDLQKVNIKLRVLFTPNTEKLGVLYQTLGLDYNERVLPSIGMWFVMESKCRFLASKTGAFQSVAFLYQNTPR